VTTTAAPRLTLGLPTYNGEEFLAEALDALLAQTYTDFELIISDNGSTDRTGEIAREYAAKDHRVRYVHHLVNRGSTFNHNFVLEQARGELFKWVSDDDLYAHPEVVLAHAWTAFIDKTGDITGAIDYPLATDAADPAERFRSLLYTHGGDDFYGVIPMSVLRKIKPFGSFHWADRTIVAELALQGPFYNVPEFLYLRRDHPTRATRIGSDVRRRCVTLDPKRADRWRHPVARLLGEYLLAYASAIWRAPISTTDRLRCTKELAVWIARHANPRYKRRLLESPDPAVKDIGIAALSDRPWSKAYADIETGAPVGQHESEAR
jgi:glycosyltransferase involved in cell wall biosynthesis